MGLTQGFKGLVVPSGVSLNVNTASISSGVTYKLIPYITPALSSNQKVYWSVNNNNVTIDDNGLVTGVTDGTSIVTVTTDYGGYTDSCTFTIFTIPVTGISLNESSISLQPGETFQLEATITPSDATNKEISWRSTDTSIAVVDSNGLVTCISGGECSVIATSVDGNYSASCSIKGLVEQIITVNFDSTAEATNAGYVFQATNYGGLTVSGGYLIVNGNHNDSTGMLYHDISNYDKRIFQARVYMQPSSWGGGQRVGVGGGDFSGTVSNSNGPNHYFNMTTASGYTGGSGISNGTTGDAVYSSGGGFTGWYVYEISYDNGTYVLTRYNDTSVVTEDSTYTHRKTFTGMGKAAQVGFSLRTGFTSQNYVKSDWAKLIYYG